MGTEKKEEGRTKRRPQIPSIKKFLRKPEHYLNGDTYFQTIIPQNGSVPEGAQGPFRRPNGGNSGRVWVVPRPDEFPKYITGVHQKRSPGSRVTHPMCLRCIELSKEIHDLPQIPYDAGEKVVRKLAKQACEIRRGQKEQLLRIRKCIEGVTAEVHPTNGVLALPNEITIGKGPGTEYHVVFDSKGEVDNPIEVSRCCCHECKKLPSSIAIAALMTTRPGILVSLVQSSEPVIWEDDTPGRSSYMSESRE